MAAAYSKELIVGAALFRFFECQNFEYIFDKFLPLYNKCYDEWGSKKFREHTCVTPEAVAAYKASHAYGTLV